MSNQEEWCPITALPRKLLDDVSQLIFGFSTGLFKVTTSPSEKKSPLLIGSGTFVCISNTFGILTAAHVVDLLRRPYSLGLILGTKVHRYTINSDYLEVIRIAKGQVDSEGPDLGFIVLPSSELGTIKAKKSFYNLDIKSDRMLTTPPEFEKGIWALCGVPDAMTVVGPSIKGFGLIKGFQMECGVGSIGHTYTVGEYDYCDFKVKYDTSPNIPQSFGGVSGGGLWQIPLRKSSEQTIEPIEYILSGVAFYQTERTGLYRSIKCHGRKSIYDMAYSFITENRKPKTENK